MIVPQALKRARILLIALLSSLCLAQLHPLSLSISLGADWAIDESDLILPFIPGEDLSPANLESVDGQAKLTVEAGLGDPAWKVTVQRSTLNWDPGIHILVKRTSLPSNIGGGTSYFEIGSGPADFFFSTIPELDALDIFCQFRLEGLSVGMGESNFTTITYTVVANN